MLLVQVGALAVQVAAGIALVVEALRGHVADGADDVAGLRQVVAALVLDQAEVGDPQLPGAVEQQVGRLDVAVDDAQVVGVRQSLGHLHPQPGHAAEVLHLRRPSQIGW